MNFLTVDSSDFCFFPRRMEKTKGGKQKRYADLTLVIHPWFSGKMGKPYPQRSASSTIGFFQGGYTPKTEHDWLGNPPCSIGNASTQIVDFRVRFTNHGS